MFGDLPAESDRMDAMTTPPNVPGALGRMSMARLSLEFPRSLAVFDDYAGAQKAVDYLSDHEFPVQNVMIVGTDLKQVERVTGRLTWGKILAGGILSGMWLGLFVGLLMSIFAGGGAWGTILAAVLTGAVFGLVWAAIGYSFTRGQRDFTSVSQVIATKYEVLVEHQLYERGRSMLADIPGGLGAQLARPTPEPGSQPARPNPYQGRYGAMRDEAAPGSDSSESSGASAAPVPPASPERPNPYEGQYGERRSDHPDLPRQDGTQPPPPPDPRG